MKFFQKTKKLVFFVCLSLLFSQPFAKTTVIVPIDIKEKMPYISFEINNAIIPFLLDSGSLTSLHLTKEVANTVSGLKYTGKMVKAMDLSGKLHESSELLVPELDVYGLKFSNLKGETLSPWGLSTKQASDDISVIGMDFFAEKRITINFSTTTLTMTEGDCEIVDGLDGWIPMPFEKVKEGYILRVGGNDKFYRMVLDTASTISIIKSTEVDENTVIDRCEYDLGPEDICQTTELSIFGAHNLHPFILNLPNQFKADGILGNDFFSRFSVLFDMKSKIFYVRPENL